MRPHTACARTWPWCRASTSSPRSSTTRRRAAGPPAVPDVTGFGLVGHVHELALASGVAARLCFADLPWLPGVRDLAEAGHVAGGSRANLDDAAAYASFDGGLAPLDRI